MSNNPDTFTCPLMRTAQTIREVLRYPMPEVPQVYVTRLRFHRVELAMMSVADQRERDSGADVTFQEMKRVHAIRTVTRECGR